jgi:hypothetical protein
LKLEFLSSELEKETLNGGFFPPGGVGAGSDDHHMVGTVFGGLQSGQLFALPLGKKSHPR